MAGTRTGGGDLASALDDAFPDEAPASDGAPSQDAPPAEPPVAPTPAAEESPTPRQGSQRRSRREDGGVTRQEAERIASQAAQEAVASMLDQFRQTAPQPPSLDALRHEVRRERQAGEHSLRQAADRVIDARAKELELDDEVALQQRRRAQAEREVRKELADLVPDPGPPLAPVPAGGTGDPGQPPSGDQMAEVLTSLNELAQTIQATEDDPGFLDQLTALSDRVDQLDPVAFATEVGRALAEDDGWLDGLSAQLKSRLAEDPEFAASLANSMPGWRDRRKAKKAAKKIVITDDDVAEPTGPDSSGVPDDGAPAVPAPAPAQPAIPIAPMGDPAGW